MKLEEYKALQERVDSKKKPLKYRNVKVEVDGEKFDSIKEAKRYGDLKLLERDGYITGLQRQVTYRLEVNGLLIAKYIADAFYYENSKLVVEDTKSEMTRKLPVYRMKKRLMFALFGITIKEI